MSCCVANATIDYNAVTIVADTITVESVADEVELDDVYGTERQLLYVACTRARDRLLITAVNPASELLNDMNVR